MREHHPVLAVYTRWLERTKERVRVLKPTDPRAERIAAKHAARDAQRLYLAARRAIYGE